MKAVNLPIESLVDKNAIFVHQHPLKVVCMYLALHPPKLQQLPQ